MSRPPRTPKRRAGFTLVELLVVILILAILIALLVPAIAGAVRSANNARVAAEITNLQTALADFRSKYGEYPPSRIFLHNNGFYNTSDRTAINGVTDTVGDLNQRTVRAMRKYFPRAGGYFSTTGPGLPVDWDGPTVNVQGQTYFSAQDVLLQGHECLIFFLGGMPDVGVDNNGNVSHFSLSGFSRDPQNPFYRTAPFPTVLIGNNVTQPSGPNRSSPLFEFSPGRLQDVFNLTAVNSAGPPNGFPSYIDPLSNTSQPRPYAYFSAYGNNAYDPNDDNSAAFGNYPDGSTIEYDDSAPPAPVGRSFLSGNNLFLSGSPNPYTNGNPIPPLVSPNVRGPVAWVNPQTFQIISAGSDGQWGYGGGYEATATEKLPVYSAPTDSNIQSTVRRRENDNITNFSGGRMQ